jgi:hypothetical protein
MTSPVAGRCTLCTYHVLLSRLLHVHAADIRVAVGSSCSNQLQTIALGMLCMRLSGLRSPGLATLLSFAFHTWHLSMPLPMPLVWLPFFASPKLASTVPPMYTVVCVMTCV